MFDCIKTGRVIVNGDDFGMSPGINAAVERLHQAGRLSSVSIMTNMPWSAAALAYASRAGDLRTGVHLNLTTGRPRLPAEQVATLVDHDGHFMPISLLLSRLLAGRVDRDELRHELEAQIEAALDAGLAIGHLDSHMHFHSVPSLGQLVSDLALRYGVPSVRNPDFSAFVMPPPSEIGPVRKALQIAGTRVLVSAQHALAGRSIGLNDPPAATRQLVYLRWCLEPGPNPPAVTFRNCICDLVVDNLEIIAHPAELDDVLPTLSGYVDGRQTEFEFLAGDAFGRMLEDL
ncbi:MAG: ChbG/HpnK family deacetylase [Chloroflexota bacterium]|jgi:predicted glycoside hydrolase/deacetylase ChbG (UPF0249 family)